MDPTGTSGQGWQESVENVLTKYEENFGAITTSIQALNQRFSHLADLLKIREPEMDQAQVAASPPVMNQESKVAPPEKYSGESGDCAAFLMQCELQFEMQLLSFPSERAKVGYVLSLLVGRARTWGSAEWKRRTECCDSFERFSREMRRVFDPVKSEHKTLNNLLSLSQGNRPVIDYIIDFRSLAADCTWNKSALYDA
uniref:Retrotransposon gag domain-containing protein n=1 Tax=Cyprinus carpio TaxID=7962 RepID=A0A8C2FFA1_CYPCA